MDTFSKLKLEQSALRILVVATGVGLTFYTGLLCFGIRHWIAEVICTVVGYSLLFGGAWLFHVCWLTWAFCIYIFAIRICIIIQPLGVFGDYIHCAHCIAFAIGLALTLHFIFNIKKYLGNYDVKQKSNIQDAA